jgi:hypothetical protein
MHVPANVPYVFISESIQVLALCISLRGPSHKSSIAFLLTELFNICPFKQASLSASWLCITLPRRKSRGLSLTFTFFVSTTPSFHFVSKNFL